MKLTESNITVRGEIDALIEKLHRKDIELIVNYDANCVHCDWVIAIRFKHLQTTFVDTNSQFREYALLIITDDNAYDKSIETINLTLQYLLGIKEPQTGAKNTNWIWDKYVEIVRNEILKYITGNIITCNYEKLDLYTAIVVPYEEFKKDVENNKCYIIY